MSFIIKERNNRHALPVLSNPLARVLKFDRFYSNFLAIPSGTYVVDFGSGDRPYEKLFLKKYALYVSLDIRRAETTHTRKPDVFIDGEALPILSDSIDCIIFTEVMQYLYEPVPVLKELFRILKPGGRLLGTVPFGLGEVDDPVDYYRFTRQCLKKMFGDAGFAVIEMEYVGDIVGVLVAGAGEITGPVLRLLRKRSSTSSPGCLTSFSKSPN